MRVCLINRHPGTGNSVEATGRPPLLIWAHIWMGPRCRKSLSMYIGGVLRTLRSRPGKPVIDHAQNDQDEDQEHVGDCERGKPLHERVPS